MIRTLSIMLCIAFLVACAGGTAHTSVAFPEAHDLKVVDWQQRGTDAPPWPASVKRVQIVVANTGIRGQYLVFVVSEGTRLHAIYLTSYQDLPSVRDQIVALADRQTLVYADPSAGGTGALLYSRVGDQSSLRRDAPSVRARQESAPPPASVAMLSPGAPGRGPITDQGSIPPCPRPPCTTTTTNDGQKGLIPGPDFLKRLREVTLHLDNLQKSIDTAFPALTSKIALPAVQ